MRLFRVCLMLFSLILLAAVSTSAQQPQTMPATLKAMFGLAPGCSVLESMQMMDIEMCHLDCGTQKPVAVAKFYNERMTAQGFTVQDFVEHSEGATVVGRKGMSTAGADVGISHGKTTTTLSVDHIKSLGGTPVGQQIIQGGGQAPAPGSAPTPTVQAQAEPNAQTGMAAVEVEGSGLAAEIFKIVSLQGGDTLTEELQINNNPVAMAISPGSIKQVLTYYENALAGQGWMKVSRMEDTDGGIVILMKDSLMFQVICDDEPETAGIDYAIMLNKGR